MITENHSPKTDTVKTQGNTHTKPRESLINMGQGQGPETNGHCFTRVLIRKRNISLVHYANVQTL